MEEPCSEIQNIFTSDWTILFIDYLFGFVGQCISRFTNRKVPYCVKFNPDEDKQSLFVAGMSDKKIVQVSINIAGKHGNIV